MTPSSDANDFSSWRDILYAKYKWILDVPPDKPLTNIVREIMDSDDGDGVFESSIFAVGMAFLDYKEQTRMLSRSEHRYARTRGGVIGMTFEISIKSVTLREYLETRDPGFRLFSTPKHLRKVTAA